jgi:molybdopterin biosynthesis enzyme
MMKPFESTISLDDALTIVRDAIEPIARRERIPIEAAHGRVLAETITARADVPSFTRSAMDGYAVIAADTQGASREHPVTLNLIGRVYAGDTSDGDAAITSGVCMEIATGAPLPLGADAVVMVEETAIAESSDDATDATGATGAANAIQVFASVRQGQHVVRRAADMREGDVVLQPGVTLEPSRNAAHAAM